MYLPEGISQKPQLPARRLKGRFLPSPAHLGHRLEMLLLGEGGCPAPFPEEEKLKQMEYKPPWASQCNMDILPRRGSDRFTPGEGIPPQACTMAEEWLGKGHEHYTQGLSHDALCSIVYGS